MVMRSKHSYPKTLAYFKHDDKDQLDALLSYESIYLLQTTVKCPQGATANPARHEKAGLSSQFNAEKAH